MMDPADAPCITVFKEKTVAGRKEHQCCYCHKPIKIGTRHHVIAYRDDDATPSQFRQDRWHRHCDGRVERFYECGTCYGVARALAAYTASLKEQGTHADPWVAMRAALAAVG